MKTMFRANFCKNANVSCKFLQEKYYNDCHIMIDPFNSIVFIFKPARDAIRKKLQAAPCKPKSSSALLNLSEVNKIILLWDENTPMRKFHHIAAVELAWRCGGICLSGGFFQIEKNNNESQTNRTVQ